ncbi:MAG: tRNA (adenosine(37)-N6)-threonylcarbamoyltransferase complex dimerization subunit type 1 TsaB [Deltaproteobacteria bacterium]|nr:tRNA (adenosine(37)-N6)-threonylcarbamoyltransferase complex dimerization subunit type 1 TsaB [Deltaproteobacteria bacterium]
MLILAIDTALRSASAALLEDQEIRAEVFIDSGKRQGECILDAVDEVLRHGRLDLSAIELFCYTAGPGSFTGLRIGAATVKGFAMTTKKPAVGVSTLDVLAMNLAGTAGAICSLVDARKNEVYAALYEGRPGKLPVKVMEDAIVDAETFLQSLSGRLLFVGDGAEKYRERINFILGEEGMIADVRFHQARASAAAVIGLQKYYNGAIVGPEAVTPRYFRSSYAVRAECRQSVPGS